MLFMLFLSRLFSEPAFLFDGIEGGKMYFLKTEQSFDSAHFLAGYHGKCANIHGHRWKDVYKRQHSITSSQFTECFRNVFQNAYIE